MLLYLISIDNNRWNKDNQVMIFNDDSKECPYSYVKLSNENKIVEIKENVKISNHACSGYYNHSIINNILILILIF